MGRRAREGRSRTLTDQATGTALATSSLRRELTNAMYRPEERWYRLADRH
ncbi:hypothetical protein [Saccharopolyspora spinosa]